MKEELYNEIYRSLKSREDIDYLLQQHPDLDFDTLFCIHSQKYQHETRMKLHNHRRIDKVKLYYSWYSNNLELSLVDIAEKINLSPCFVARIILHAHFHMTTHGQIRELSQNDKSHVNKLMRNPLLVKDERLRAEVIECIESDDTYSPLIDKIRHFVGLEYEFILQEKCHNFQLSFLSEDAIRSRGFAKTPDILLEVPILVNNCVVNWIESKALFGDHYTHLKNLPQFWGYANRYGPGLVLYWFGFIDELNTNQDEGILLLDSFPETFTRITD